MLIFSPSIKIKVMNFQIITLKAEYETYGSRQGEPYRFNNKLYIWPEGESVIDNLFNRRNRPSNAWKKEIIPAIMAKLQEVDPQIYERVKGEKWGWRQKCGCSCPCSPGFVGTSHGKYTIHATVKFTEE
jgi:hypothetical protein